ncbi:MaoC family dehydratase [Noviherbaspirillum sedimenti]|uniref:MaoC family dehydratase n=1 Tax=Noviherbaspirillum sedimenti TaxID=2320865 RepID=A0A3A3G952_9BURK|nr:MaoC family dehydratase [Noviherbaspirillum sedimenti]RJG04185.1 MaoC family dehydratase [Noviherbaspirillum sedimenti]
MTERTRQTITIDEYRKSIGACGNSSEWLLVTQAMIDEFASITGDDAFIHVDPVRAAKTHFGGTIAHGLLTLSLLTKLMHTAVPVIEGTKMGINYGFDRVRFVTPLPVNSRIRARFDLAEISEPKPRFILVTYMVSVEIKNQQRPTLVARWMLGRWLSK